MQGLSFPVRMLDPHMGLALAPSKGFCRRASSFMEGYLVGLATFFVMMPGRSLLRWHLFLCGYGSLIHGWCSNALPALPISALEHTRFERTEHGHLSVEAVEISKLAARLM